MKKEKQVFIQWVKAHKRALIIAGISVAAIIGIIVGIKKKETLMELWSCLQKQMGSSSYVPIEKTEEVLYKTEIIGFPAKRNLLASIEVSDHLRNLPDGWQASEQKITSALEHGYHLEVGQTWVNTYTKNRVVA